MLTAILAGDVLIYGGVGLPAEASAQAGIAGDEYIKREIRNFFVLYFLLFKVLL